MLYRNDWKNREYAKEAAQIFAPGASRIAREQEASEGRKFAAKPTQPGAPEERFALWGKASAETDSSGCFGIWWLVTSIFFRYQRQIRKRM